LPEMKTVISSSDRSLINFAELKRYGGLFKYIAIRDVFVRYKQTWIGFGWSILRPLINIAIFGTLSFLVDKEGEVKEKFLKVSAGILFWQLLSTSITDVSNSLSSNANILSKVYFPKLLLPLSALVVCLIDFLIGFVIFMLLFIIFKGLPAWQIIFLPLLTFYGLVLCFGIGLIFATASVKYRDVKFILPFIIQILFYVSPVFLSSEFILKMHLPEAIKIIYQLNPFVFLLNAFKFCMFGHFENYNLMFAGISFLLSILILIFSVKYFLNFEKSFADHI
jgi:lipopolysaccharide transport system permease protein